eukprot:6211530-Pleurochrysis_carterae.AAC.2
MDPMHTSKKQDRGVKRGRGSIAAVSRLHEALLLAERLKQPSALELELRVQRLGLVAPRTTLGLQTTRTHTRTRMGRRAHEILTDSHPTHTERPFRSPAATTRVVKIALPTKARRELAMLLTTRRQTRTCSCRAARALSEALAASCFASSVSSRSFHSAYDEQSNVLMRPCTHLLLCTPVDKPDQLERALDPLNGITAQTRAPGSPYSCHASFSRRVFKTEPNSPYPSVSPLAIQRHLLEPTRGESQQDAPAPWRCAARWPRIAPPSPLRPCPTPDAAAAAPRRTGAGERATRATLPRRPEADDAGPPRSWPPQPSAQSARSGLATCPWPCARRAQRATPVASRSAFSISID